ncbi:MAG: polysaccharide pyruvyl transferase CsaB [Clostridia bacterium]|nr:polysaccharide pyruvyl transferase CsaB [Clostridia bacterium]
MKVLHIISGGDSGGAKTHMFTLLDEQCKLASVTVACLMKGVFWRELQERPVKSIMFEQKHRFDMSVCSEIVKFIRNEKTDIVNVHGARANFIAAQIKRKISCPIVTTVHSDYLLDFDTPVKKVLFGGLNRWALRKIDYRIGVSDAFRKMLIERGFEANTTYTVYNGIDFSHAVPNSASRREFAKKHGIPFDENAVYVGIAARFDRVKGVDVFIESAALVLLKEKNVHFVIAGDGALGDELKARCKELGIENNVHFIGFVSPIWDFLSFIDINMLTSRCESFPYALLEGAKAGKATVASAVGGIPDLIRNGKTGLLFTSENTVECADAVVRLVRSRELREKYSNALYALAEKEYSNLALAKRYIANYNSIISHYSRDKKYDIILSGYYGFDNYGDELILETLIAAYKKARPDIQLLILSHSPKKTSLQTGINSIGRFYLPMIKRAMKQSRMYVNGGGTLLTDVTSRRSLRYYTSMLRMAKNNGLKTMLLANGIGPFTSEASKAMAVKSFRYIDLITLRDKGTLYNLSEELKSVETYLTADLAFISGLVLSDGERSPKTDGKYFIVCVREWQGNVNGFEEIIASCCDKICEKYALRCLIFPMQAHKDTEISKRIASLMHTNPEIYKSDSTIKERANEIANAEFVLSMRLHTLISALMNQVPCVALSYDDKVTNFMTEQNAGAVIGADKLTREALLSELEKLASGDFARDRDDKELSELSWKNIELSLNLLDRAEK